MPEEPQERTYKSIERELIIESITTLKWLDHQTRRFNDAKIFRGTIYELKKVVPELEKYYFRYGYDLYTLFFGVEIKDSKVLQLDDIQYKLPHIILLESKWSDIEIKNCMLSEKEGGKPSRITNFNLFDSQIGDLSIRENSLIGLFDIRNGSSTGFFSVRGNSLIGDFRIRNSKTKYFKIEHSLTGDLDIINSQTGNFEVNNSLIVNFNINNSQIGNFRISNNSQIADFDIIDSKIDNIKIKNNCQIGDLLIENTKSPLIKITDSQLHLFLNKVTIGQCKLNNCSIANLTLKNECTIELYVSGGAVNLIDFEQLSLSKNTILSFSKIALYACNMDEFSALGNLFFRSITKTNQPYSFIENIKYLDNELENEHIKVILQRKKRQQEWLKEKYENGLVQLQKRLKITKPTFRIVQSSLGKTEFAECDLNAFRFEYNNSKLTENFISGGTLPKEVFIPNERKFSKRLDQQKAFFNQLKKIFDNQGDIVRSNYYQAKAAEKQLVISILKFRPFEFLVYFFNLISNNHGRSWFVALLFIVAVSHIGFYFYNSCLSTPIYSFEWGNTGYLGDLAQFILPTHKFDFMVKEPNSNAVVIDFVSRLFIGYGIYQFISAFRKHGKRA